MRGFSNDRTSDSGSLRTLERVIRTLYRRSYDNAGIFWGQWFAEVPEGAAKAMGRNMRIFAWKKFPGIVRDDSKAQVWKDKGVAVVTANYDDHLTAAFTGVQRVFCMLPPNVVPDLGFPDSIARIAAIKKAVLTVKPPWAVFLSSIGGEKTSGLGLVTTAHLLEKELGNASSIIDPALVSKIECSHLLKAHE